MVGSSSGFVALGASHFEPLVAETVEELEPPSGKELRLLREEIDPERAILGRL